MITVHHLNLSRSQRVLWLLEELGLPYEVKHYQRDPRTLLAPEALRSVHPLGRSPVITEDGVTLAESGAILEYLAEREGSALSPAPGTPQRVRYLYWMHYAEGSLMPPLLVKRLFERIGNTEGLAGFVLPLLERQLAYVESELAQRPWFAGDAFTAADIQMSYALEVAKQRVDLTGQPHLRLFLERIRARPAYQRAQQRGGPFGVPSSPD